MSVGLFSSRLAVVRVDVSVNLNDQPYIGFSVEFAPPLKLYLPLIKKP